MVKSLLESNGKPFRQIAIRENFNLKPETQHKKTLYKNRSITPINTVK